jgi:hypothetical protein
LADIDAGHVVTDAEGAADMEHFFAELAHKATRQLEWSKRSIADRKKIARFYKKEASLASQCPLVIAPYASLLETQHEPFT